MEINYLPDSLLLFVFHHLNANDVVSCSAVCSQWNRICKDQKLWSRLIQKDFLSSKSVSERDKTLLDLSSDSKLWMNEYKRLACQSPCLLDKVLYKTTGLGFVINFTQLAFSQDGSELVACSDTGLLLRWQKDESGDLKLIQESKFERYFEIYGIHYNSSDTKILLTAKTFRFRCDLLQHATTEYAGSEILMYCITNNSLSFLGRFSFESNSMSACWYTNDVIIVAVDAEDLPRDRLIYHGKSISRQQ